MEAGAKDYSSNEDPHDSAEPFSVLKALDKPSMDEDIPKFGSRGIFQLATPFARVEATHRRVFFVRAFAKRRLHGTSKSAQKCHLERRQCELRRRGVEIDHEFMFERESRF